MTLSDLLARAADQFLTDPKAAKAFVEWVKERLPLKKVTEWVEPAAGENVIGRQVGAKAYDLSPLAPDVEQLNYLTTPFGYKAGRATVGNPPYGTRGDLARRFLEKSLQESDYAGMILPRSFARLETGVRGGRLIDQALLPPNIFHYPSGTPTAPIKTVAQLWERAPAEKAVRQSARQEGPFYWAGTKGLDPTEFNTAVNQATGQIARGIDITSPSWLVGNLTDAERNMLEQHLDPAVLKELSTTNRANITIADLRRALRGENTSLPPALLPVAAAADLAHGSIRETPQNPFLGQLVQKVKTVRDIAKGLADNPAKGTGMVGPHTIGQIAEMFLPSEEAMKTVENYSYGQPPPQKAGPLPWVNPENARLVGEAAMNAPWGTLGAGAGLIKGAGSRTFPHEAAVEANRMIRQGVPDQTVHAITGLWRSPGDLKLRQEINDFNAALTSEGEQALAQTLGTGQASPYAPLHRYMEHPEAFEAYPSLAQVNTRFLPQAGSRLTRFANPGQEIHQQVEFNVGAVPWKSQGGQPLHYTDNAKLSLLHEMTHAIQQVEEMQGGGSPEAIVRPEWIVRAARLIEAAKQANIDPDILRAYEEAFSNAQKRLYAGDPEQGYLRIPGEVEARMVERRAGMTHHQRQPSFPLNSYDVPAREVLWDWPTARPKSFW